MRQSSILIPVIGTLQECASEKSYCLAMQSEGMIEDLVRNLSSSNQQLKMLCASAIFRFVIEHAILYVPKLIMPSLGWLRRERAAIWSNFMVDLSHWSIW